MEEDFEEKEQPKLNYKITDGNEYTINRQDYNGKTFYNILVSKKNLDGTTEYGKKIVRFKKDVELQDKTRIKIIQGFEDFYNKGFNTIFTLFIGDFEIMSQPEGVINEAYDEFNSTSNFDLPF